MFYMAVQYWDTKPYCSETYTLKWRLERFSHKMQSLPSLGEVTLIISWYKQQHLRVLNTVLESILTIMPWEREPSCTQ